MQTDLGKGMPVSSARKLPQSLLVPRDICLSELTVSLIPEGLVSCLERAGTRFILFPVIFS